jgi:GalNAc-alpha-(1->4)-GalNAc-alpha-(1->3)-diNAcBac-PP-undecaprenol alpha-1,4-N-acetyl-D-galactosaminyltransferase
MNLKIAFIISSLDSGGAERVLCLIANYWAKKKYRIVIITLGNSTPFYLLEDNIQLEPLSLLKNSESVLSAIANNIGRIKAIRKRLLEIDPDIVISFMTETNIISTIGCKMINKPIIISERTCYDFLNSRAWIILRKLVYKFSNALIVQTKYDKEKYSQLSNKFVIENPLNFKGVIFKKSRREKNILAVGRLTREKGFDRLIRAFARLENKTWKMTIIGEGSERKFLEQLINDLKLNTYISMPGRTKAIEKWYEKSSIFVLSSRIEGFPNVLCEAMAFGCACVSFDCTAGPSEIISDKVNGYLVKNGDIDALAAKLRFLINHPAERYRIGNEAIKIRERLDIDSIMSEWDQVIKRILIPK